MRLHLLGMLALAGTAAVPHPVGADTWPGFRGATSQGVADGGQLPSDLDAKTSLLWRTSVPPGFSSPVVAGGRVFLTGYENDQLFTIALDSKTGVELWRREAPRARTTKRPVNTPVSPTPATDGNAVYVLFEDYGLLAYAADGKPLWQRPLGPFALPYGLGASPFVVGRRLIVLIDQDKGSFLASFDTKDGSERWRTERPEAQHGFATPSVYRPGGGPPELVVLGSYELTGYALETGERLWWVRGMAWQAKSTPVIDGDTVYVNSSMPTMNDIDNHGKLADFESVRKERDANGNGKIDLDEAPAESMKKLWILYDLDKDGALDEREWRVAQARDTAKSGLYAVKLGGKGDLTETAVQWRYERSLPNIPTPLLYRGMLYVLREGGILTTLDPATGLVAEQGRLEGALDPYFASPVAGDAKIFCASQSGKLTVVKAGGEWEILSQADLGEEIWATPALADGHLIVRTQKGLYCFGRPQPRAAS